MAFQTFCIDTYMEYIVMIVVKGIGEKCWLMQMNHQVDVQEIKKDICLYESQAKTLKVIYKLYLK